MKEIIDLIGTKWIVSSFGTNLKDVILKFYPNGVLKYGDRADKWEIKNEKIVMSVNSYFTMIGEIANDKLVGKALNIRGDEWTFEGTAFKSDNNVFGGLENEDELNNQLEKKLNNLGAKWRVKNYGMTTLIDSVLEFSPKGVLKKDDCDIGKWEIKSGKIIMSFENGYFTYTGEILANKLLGDASNIDGDKWTFEGSLFIDHHHNNNLQTIHFTKENQGHGLFTAGESMWYNWKLLDNGSFSETDDSFTLTSINGQTYVAAKAEVSWEAKLYNPHFDSDERSYDIYSGKNPNGGQFLLYRYKDSNRRNEFIIRTIGAESQGSSITFEIM